MHLPAEHRVHLACVIPLHAHRIARRELEQYFATPLGWIVLTAFLAVTGFFFAFALFEFQEVSIQAQASPYGDGGPTVNDWLLPAIFSNWAIILLLVAPAVTMRLFSEDMRQRSLELLLSSPLSSGQIVLGKFAGVVGFLLVVFALTTYQVAVLMWLGSPDPGIVATSYLAMFLLAAACVAVGMHVPIDRRIGRRALADGCCGRARRRLLKLPM